MPVALDWGQIVGLDPAIVKKSVDFPVNVEEMYSKDNNLMSRRRMISIEEPNQAKQTILELGEVPATRPLIKHTEAMDLVISELDQVLLPYKLRRSILDDKKYSLYQEYVFDQVVDAPDGNAIAPMVIVRSRYVGGAPLDVALGTYRYVCENGALVLGDPEIQHIRVSASNWDMYSKTGFSSDIKRSLDHFTKVSVMYTALHNTALSDGYKELFSFKPLPLGFRKKLLADLEASGAVTINVETDKTDVTSFAKLITAEDLAPEVIDSTIQVTGDESMWDVYNRATDRATHKMTSISGSTYVGMRVEQAFRKAIA